MAENNPKGKKKLLVKSNRAPEGYKLKKGIKPPTGWDLYEHGVSYSLLSKFIVCRERFRLRVVEGLVPGGTKEAMEFGTIFHKGLELSALGYTHTRILAYFNAKSRTRMAGRKRLNYDPMLCKIATMMLPMYKSHWSEVLGKIKYFESEQKFRVLHRTSTGFTVPLNGKRDEGFTKDGKIWLQENKTKSTISEDQIIQTLSSMLQPMLYLYSFQHDHPGKELGGILYNVIRKPGLEQGKASERDYLNRIKKDIEDRPDHYFKMFEVDISHEDVQRWVTRYLDPLLCQVCIWWESIKHNPFDPWTTPDPRVVNWEGLSEDLKEKSLVANPHHFLRPFGVYDAMSHGLGDYFSRVVHGTDQGLEFNAEIFPELNEDDDTDLKGSVSKTTGKHRI